MPGRAYVELTTKGIQIGAEHLPRCPRTVEEEQEDQAPRLASSEMALTDIERACDCATRAIEPWHWPIRRTFAVGHALRRRHAHSTEARLYRFANPAYTHALFDSCVWYVDIEIPNLRLRSIAAKTAAQYLTERGYEMVARLR